MRVHRFLLPAVFVPFAFAQTPEKLSLDQARRIALANHPRIASATLSAQAAHTAVQEVRSLLYPQLTGAFTAVGADHGTSLAAGILQTSSLNSRVAGGVNISQLITDFGRTSNLSETAKLRASARDQGTVSVRAQIQIDVSAAYYQTLAAAKVLDVSRAVVENRRLVLRQVQALAQSALKSTLDVRFAEVAVSQAELTVYRAQNDVESAQARLNAALGNTQPVRYDTMDEPLPGPLPPDSAAFLAEALQQRADLAALRLEADSAHRFAEAEHRLRYPTVSILGTAGGLPAADPRLRQEYAAAGVNLSIPVLNGGLFSARQKEAELRALAADKDLQDLSLAITSQVRLAFLESNTAFLRLDTTARLVAEASEALRLAQARYDTGLSGIVELNQAQLAQVSAEIDAATAKYQYLITRATLDFVLGRLR